MKVKKTFLRFIAITLSMVCVFTGGISSFAFSENGANETTGVIEIPENTIGGSDTLENMQSSAISPDGYVPIESSVSPALFAQVLPNVDITNVLLIEDTLPWSSNANSQVLNSLGARFDKVASNDFLNKDLGNYSVLIFANDQQTISYANYVTFMDRVETFAELGGIVIFGACDGGWASGNLQTLLPGGVVPFRQYSNYNYIENSSHPIVTGELTNGAALTDSDLYSNYCSHTSFDEYSLPENSNIILRDSIQNAPTLVEYPVGRGTIIASGLTWEYTYVNKQTFSPKAMDDLFSYAISLSNADVNMRPPLALSVSAPVEISIENNKYDPNPFEITAYIQNIGDGEAENVLITLDTFSDLELIEGSPIVNLGFISVDEQVSVTWKVKIKPGNSERNAPFKITLTSDNSETKELTREIYIPELIPTNDLELFLDRSSLTPGNVLRINFKILNKGAEAIRLNDISSRFYFTDETPDLNKTFSIYNANLDKPYSYLGNSAVKGKAVKQEQEIYYVLSDSFLEFGFNSTSELLPNQEIVVSAGINNANWTNFLTANDFSAVGDDSFPENGYASWEYMPVYVDNSLVWGVEPEIDENGKEPNLRVEINPADIGGVGFMNLSIRITNDGLIPIDLGKTEVKYYYVNDRGYKQSAAGDYIGGRINNSHSGITDKVILDIVKMEERKKMADTYLSVKFAENAGVLYFEDYIELKVRIFNTEWQQGNYDYQNHHSFQEEEQQLQPLLLSFNDFAQSGNDSGNTPGFRHAPNIVLATKIGHQSFWDFFWGKEPEELYDAKFSIFKVGEGSAVQNTIDDYFAAYRGLTGGIFASPYDFRNSMGENITKDLNFNYENLKSILESDIAYISGHGFDGGVIPIYNRAFVNGVSVGVNNYNMFLTADKNVGRDYHHYDATPVSESNIFSLNMKDHRDEDINENLKWLILASCHQFSESTGPFSTNLNNKENYNISHSSLERWIDVLKNNKEMKGILGYYLTAPTADNERVTDEEVISDFFEESSNRKSIYNAWLKANSSIETRQVLGFDVDFHSSLGNGLLVKDNYEDQDLYSSLADNKEVGYSRIYLYKFSSGLLSVNSDRENVTQKYSRILNSYAMTSGFNLPEEIEISLISRDVFDANGKYIYNEEVECLIHLENKAQISTYSTKRSHPSETILRINFETEEVDVFK